MLCMEYPSSESIVPLKQKPKTSAVTNLLKFLIIHYLIF